MALNPAQLKKLRVMLKKINKAIDLGNTTPAINTLHKLNTQYPRNPMVLTLLGRANSKIGRHSESIEAYKQAVKNKPKDGELRSQYALALQKGGRYEEALLELERTLYYIPNDYHALRYKCSVLNDLNQTDKALAAHNALRSSVEGQQLSASYQLGIAVSGARLAPKAIDAAAAVEEIERSIDDPSCEDGLLVPAYWHMGRLYSHLKEYDKAFESYKNCKEIKKENWDPDEHSKRIDQLIACWTGDAQIPYTEIDGSRLIFILGMMRSGTSLTEQMIAQVEGVTAGGEMNAISRQLPQIEQSTMPHGRPHPSTPQLYTKGTLKKMGEAAMQMYNDIARTGYITDKQPYNYLYAPLIAHMFPGCKIIHCVRNPMDCCLSNYTQSFSRPHMQTHDLYWLGRYYRDYERLMQAWHTIDEIDMIDLHYEQLVEDPEGESKRVMAFLGIEWTEDILNFHTSSRIVSTSSRDQVRKPIYTSSVKKYKHYENHLDELKRGLGIEIED